jgi:PilZ domain
MVIEKRARPRLKLSMPVQIVGNSVDGEKFREIGQSQDASAFGLRILTQTFVAQGNILLLSMPMPRRLRLFDLTHDVYNVYGQVQRVQVLAQGDFELGISFIGRTPPDGHQGFNSWQYAGLPIKPLRLGQLTPLKNDSFLTFSSTVSKNKANLPTLSDVTPLTPAMVAAAAEKLPAGTGHATTRREERHTIPYDAKIEFFDTFGAIVHQEPGLVTNISANGACITTSYPSQVGNRLRLTLLQDNFVVHASVKGISGEKEGVWNLHLQFLDKIWPVS